MQEEVYFIMIILRQIIKYKKTTISVKYYLLENYARHLSNEGYIHRKDYYKDNQKIINKLIREELDRENITDKLSQYVEYWLYNETLKIFNIIRH